MSSLLKRVIISLILVPLIMGVIYLPSLFIFLFLIIWMGVANYEFLNLCDIKSSIFFIFSFAGIVFVLYTQFKKVDFSSFFIFGYILIGVVLWSFLEGSKPTKSFLPLLFSPFYLGWLPGHILRLKQLSFFYKNGYWLVLFPFVVTWINDTGAYFTGLWLGKHKLAPKLSPKKTWEGFLGGILWSGAFSIIYRYLFLPNFPLIGMIVSSVILGVVAEIGDIFESGFKRERGIKDSGRIFLEHGGFLDRIDSLIFTIPTFYYFLRILIL